MIRQASEKLVPWLFFGGSGHHEAFDPQIGWEDPSFGEVVGSITACVLCLHTRSMP